MPQAYSNPARANDPYALPDIEIFQLTARETAELDEELIWEYMRRYEFRLAAMNAKTREAMFDAIIEDNNLKGGWFWWSCFPGCLPDGPAIGPFETYQEALDDAREV